VRVNTTQGESRKKAPHPGGKKKKSSASLESVAKKPPPSKTKNGYTWIIKEKQRGGKSAVEKFDWGPKTGGLEEEENNIVEGE